ncbi:hypothetical protein DAPPUDRAFT_323023 [Daphnia pulex]|uniref:Tubulin-folding cofactor D C-terminal domain-containing protein n=1 Tax=Daphnia pulex TaxID=6669 RepID=E9GXQ0_DAPPU|nr:hypothetical protein DAPPUDRAFT_323023 [Daphnia pulex]|eukprot:EFX75778.1 hypothetical protein DAPPUDRAFT_323023 [Daphnia pulex]
MFRFVDEGDATRSLDTYRKAVITGLVSSIGSLTESLVKSSSASSKLTIARF